MKTGIFYGSSMGNTEDLANKIAELLDMSADVCSVSDVTADKVLEYDTLLFGSSTWGLGELQDDWYDYLDQLKTQNLSGKKVGLFGCGDADSYADTFCDAMAIIYDAIENSGCEFIGAYEPEGYSSTVCAINRDGKFIGLAIDDSEGNKTDERVANWVSLIKSQL